MTDQERYEMAIKLAAAAKELYGTPGWKVGDRMNEIALELLAEQSK